MHNDNTSQHPCEAIPASPESMSLAEMILSDCGCSTAISDSLQRRVAGRIQRHMDSVLSSRQQADPVAWGMNKKTILALAAELVRGAECMGDDDTELTLEVRMPGTVRDDDGNLNVGPVLAISDAEYPEEGVYPIDPHNPTAGREPEAQQQAEPVAMSLPFFAYDSETGFERFATEAKAKAAAQESIDAYREEAGEGWAEAVENICWGVVLGTTHEVVLPDEYSGGNGLADSMKPVDYVLTEAAQPPAVVVPDVDWLAQVIRAVDGNNKLGAGALAEKIVDAMLAAAQEGGA